MIDQMAYNYQTGTNKLNYIADPYHLTSADIEGQSANNYTYDAIGNLTQDVKGGINDIMWNPYGKITRIDKGTNGVLLYSYDAMGNRIKKSFTQSNDNADKTWYVRDASGNIMAIYSRKNYGTNQQVLLENYELYGSSRLGSLNLGIPVEGDYNLTATTNYTRSLGLKQYELSNHLGNVLTTFSDQRVFAPAGMSSTNSNALIAKLISAQDYYPFGMIMDGKSWNTDKVKFGFNGKENDNEIAGNNNSLDFGARIYNPRIGRMLSVDPLFRRYLWQSPYCAFDNKPIIMIDPTGMGVEPTIKTDGNDKTTAEVKCTIYVYTDQDNVDIDEFAKKYKEGLEEQLNKGNVRVQKPDFDVNGNKTKRSRSTVTATTSFNITVIPVSMDEAVKLANSNQDLAVNFVYVYNDPQGGRNHMRGGNSGIVNSFESSKIWTHEFIHMMAWSLFSSFAESWYMTANKNIDFSHEPVLENHIMFGATTDKWSEEATVNNNTYERINFNHPLKNGVKFGMPMLNNIYNNENRLIPINNNSYNEDKKDVFNFNPE